MMGGNYVIMVGSFTKEWCNFSNILSFLAETLSFKDYLVPYMREFKKERPEVENRKGHLKRKGHQNWPIRITIEEKLEGQIIINY